MRKFTVITGLIMFLGLIAYTLTAQNSFTGEFNYTSPRAEAQYASPHHHIALRHGDALDINSIKVSMIEVTGSLSGSHAGQVVLSADSRTLLFKPATPFAYNETVTVNVSGGIKTKSGLLLSPLFYTFQVMKEDNTIHRDNFVEWYSEQNKAMLGSENVSEAQQFSGAKKTMELPEDYPPYFVTIINNPSPGYLYCNPHNVFHPLNLPGYSIVMDHYGTPVYYKRFDTHTLDFNIQETGEISQFIAEAAGGLGIGFGTFYTYDENMNELNGYQMGNGYMAEMHDFQLFNDGSYLLFTYDAQIVDMSVIVEGGDPAATVMGFVLQELDAGGNVVFEWSSWDHMEITDATPDVDLTGVFIDYCHGNAVELDNDGNIMVSFRNTDEIIKIDRATGDIMWRWNSNREDLNDITFVDDEVGFSHQHDIRRIENGNVIMFDNGNLHGPPPYTRILEYTLDEENKTATAANVYPQQWVPGTYFAFATGSVHRQPDGNTTIGWGVGFGVLPMMGEITADGVVTYEMFGVDTTTTYRARKYPWEPTLFSLSKDTIDWGEFTGYTPEPYILQFTNNTENPMVISGVGNHLQEFYVTSTFPITVEAGATQNITVNFFPSVEGFYEDVLTVMVEKAELEMIGKQVVMMGHTSDESAPEASFNPEDETSDMIRMPKLTMTFNEKLYKTDGEEITQADLMDIFYLKAEGGDNLPFMAKIMWYDNSKTEIFMQPFDYLEANTTFEWGVNGNTVQDWAENVIGTNTFATFTTGEEMGLDDITVEDFARVYPNPTSGIINLEFTNNDEKSVMIYNMAGDEVFRLDQLTAKAYYFDISNQPEGIYIVRVINQSNNSSTELKVIKK